MFSWHVVEMSGEMTCIYMRCSPGYTWLCDRTISLPNTYCSYASNQINRISSTAVVLCYGYTSWAWLLAKWYIIRYRWWRLQC
jgi:hypothetical protein